MEFMQVSIFILQGLRPRRQDRRMMDEFMHALDTCNISINEVNHCLFVEKYGYKTKKRNSKRGFSKMVK